MLYHSAMGLILQLLSRFERLIKIHDSLFRGSLFQGFFAIHFTVTLAGLKNKKNIVRFHEQAGISLYLVRYIGVCVDENHLEQVPSQFLKNRKIWKLKEM